MILLGVFLSLGTAAVILAGWGAREWLSERREDRDAEGRRVIEGVVLLAGQAQVPIVLGRAVAPVVPSTWDERAAYFAAYVNDFAAKLRRRREILQTPTAAYRTVVAENFGVYLSEVGPREAELVCTRELWDPGSGEWRQLDLLAEAVS